MYLTVALAPAYPPDSGEPASTAPLENAVTVLPGSRGSSSASRVQPNTWRTSVSHGALNVSQVWCWMGRDSGAAPAASTRVCGRNWDSSAPAVTGSAASAATGVKPAPICSRTPARAAASRATPTTAAPSFASAAAMARPKPRLAPVTTAVLPDSCRSVMTVSCSGRAVLVRRGPDGPGPVTQADTGRAGNSSPSGAMTFGAGRDLYR